MPTQTTSTARRTPPAPAALNCVEVVPCIRGEGREEHDEQGDQLEEERERLDARVRNAARLRARADDQQVERMGAEPEQRGEPPARDAPTNEGDYRQQERQHDRSPRRGQQVIRLGAPS